MAVIQLRHLKEVTAVVVAWVAVQAVAMSLVYNKYYFSSLTEDVLLYGGGTVLTSAILYPRSHTSSLFAALHCLHGITHYAFPFLNENGYDYSNVYPYISWPDIIVHLVQFALHAYVQHHTAYTGSFYFYAPTGGSLPLRAEGCSPV